MLFLLVGMRGFEPPALASRNRVDEDAAYGALANYEVGQLDRKEREEPVDRLEGATGKDMGAGTAVVSVDLEE